MIKLLPTVLLAAISIFSSTAVESRVIDGAKVLEDESTSFNIFIYSPDGLCSGSLISPTFILTAGHCFKGSDISNVKVIHGTEFKYHTTTNAPKVKDVYVHPEFDRTTLQNDLALIELQEQVDPAYRPIILMKGVPGRVFPIQTFGYSPVIKDPNFDLLSSWKDISPSYNRDELEKNGITRLHTKVLAAIADKDSSIHMEQQHGGICSGDSGGPVTVNVNGLLMQIGINRAAARTSDQTVTCNSTGNALGVMSYLPWIKEIMSRSESTLPEPHQFESTDSLNSNDEKCIRLQLKVVDQSRSYRPTKNKKCFRSIIWNLKLLDSDLKRYCVSEGTKSYPKYVSDAVEKLEAECQSDN